MPPGWRGSRCGGCWPTCRRADGRPGRLPLPRGRTDPRRGAGPAGARRRGQGRADRGPAARRLPGLRDTPGWLGYSDERLAELCAEAAGRASARSSSRSGPGWRTTSGAGHRPRGGRRRHRHRAGREPGVGRADRHPWVRALAPVRPAWIEEPTSPDDILGAGRGSGAAVRPVPVATGEHVANRVMFKQLLQARAIDIMQIDACRVAGVNENMANLLLAAKFGVPVCPHAGGVGLCEIVQHLSMFDYVALSGTMHGRMIEWIDHLHEHFVTRRVVAGGRYVAAGGPRRVRRSSGRSRWPSSRSRPAAPGARWRRCDHAGRAAAAQVPRPRRRWAAPACGSPGWSSAAPPSAACSPPSARTPRGRRWRRPGRPGSAPSTPRRTTAPACPSSGSAASSPGRRGRSTSCHQGRPAAGADGRRRRRGRELLRRAAAGPDQGLQPGRRAGLGRGEPAAARHRPDRHRAHPRPGRLRGRRRWTAPIRRWPSCGPRAWSARSASG